MLDKHNKHEANDKVISIPEKINFFESTSAYFSAIDEEAKQLIPLPMTYINATFSRLSLGLIKIYKYTIAEIIYVKNAGRNIFPENNKA